MPVTTAAGFCGQAKKFDYQAGMEKSLGVLFSIMTGSHLHTLQGSFAGELGYSNVLQVLDEDIAGSIGRFLQGSEIDDETLALDESLEVGTAPASFMNRPLTRKYWAHNRYSPFVADWGTHVDWVRGGKTDIVQRAREKADDIVASHRAAPLSAGQVAEVEQILSEARDYYRGNGLIAEDEWSPYERALQAADLP